MKAFDYEPEFKKTLLDNGVRVVTEHHKYSRATSAGIYVDLGTRDEPNNMVGAAHFVEHMVFKGTRSRSAYDIVKDLEAVGGEINAYTSKEYTCFHAGTLREDMDVAMDVLVDIMTEAEFAPGEFEKERDVIKQEILMSEDLLEEYIFDLYFEKAYRGHNLDRPILGTDESLDAIGVQQLKDFYKERYHGRDMIVSVAGSVNHDDVVDRVKSAFGGQTSDFKAPERVAPQIQAFTEIIKKPSEQEHLLVGFPSTSFKDKYRFESYVLNAVLGSGMTSRLYQKIREEKGLAYSVYSYLHSFTDSGLLMFYAGASADSFQEILDLLFYELNDIMAKGVSDEEIEFFKKQVVGSIVLGADDIENRMNSLGVNEMIFGEYRSVDQVLKEVESVNSSTMKEYIQKYFDFSQMGMIALGDVDQESMGQLLNSYRP